MDSKKVEPDNPDSALATVGGAVAGLVTGAAIPTTVRKNAIKAFGQLCSAAIDIPIAYLEGISSEKRAETQARIKIISTGADQIAAQMKVDPEYARVAVKKYGQKIVREQVNLDMVSEVAARQIQQDASQTDAEQNTTETAQINDDWLNHFEKEASQKSTEEMQLLFGRILAGEIQRPSSFSIKTVKLLGELDSAAASLFRNLCSLSISLRLGEQIFDARVSALGGNAGANALLDYGLAFSDLNVLQQHGLIIPDYNSYMDYKMCIADKDRKVAVGFIHQNQKWGLLPLAEQPQDQTMRINGVSLSPSGRELIKIVDIQPTKSYTAALKEHFRTLNFEMVEITKGLS